MDISLLKNIWSIQYVFWGIDIILKENFYNTYSQQNIESRIEKIVNVINQMNFSKMPHFTSYQEAAFQNYKFAFSLNKEQKNTDIGKRMACSVQIRWKSYIN